MPSCLTLYNFNHIHHIHQFFSLQYQNGIKVVFVVVRFGFEFQIEHGYRMNVHYCLCLPSEEHVTCHDWNILVTKTHPRLNVHIWTVSSKIISYKVSFQDHPSLCRAMWGMKIALEIQVRVAFNNLVMGFQFGCKQQATNGCHMPRSVAALSVNLKQMGLFTDVVWQWRPRSHHACI